MLFTNKHFIAALIITPILAIIGYLSMDMLLSEKPKTAEAGAQYKLVALPNCRYSSGRCVMKNGNFVIEIVGQPQADGQLILQLESEFPLQQVNVAIAPSDDLQQPFSAMFPQADDGRIWQLNVAHAVPQSHQLRLVVKAGEALYYGDSQMAFMHYETAFGKDFRQAQK